MFKSNFLLFICFVFSFCCVAQQNDIIYLNGFIEQNKVKTDEKALEKAFQVALKKQKTTLEKTTIEIVYAILLADLHFKKVEQINVKSDLLYKDAISRSSKINTDLSIWSNTSYGFYLYSNNLYKDALPYFLAASRLIDKSNSNLVLQTTDVLKKNAFYFGSIQDYTKEADYLKKALLVTDKKSFDYGTLLNSLGRNYANNGNNELAEKYYNETLRVSKANNDEVRYAKALGDLATLFEQNKNWQKAEEYLLKDIAISKENDGKRNTMFAQIQLGNLYFKKSEYEKAIEVLNPAENYAKSKSNLKGFEEEIAKLKLAIAIKQNDDRTELEQRRKLDTLTLQVSKTDGEQVITRINLETEKENIKLQLVAQKEKIDKQAIVNKVIIIISVILLFTTILMFMHYKRKINR